MTDQLNDEIVDETTEPQGINRRRMFLAGAGLAGAAALAKAGTASAADGDDVRVGGEYDAESATAFTIGGSAPIAGDLNALRGTVSTATNGSHAISGATAGDGHAISGTSSKLDNGRASTWGRHSGAGAGVGGENDAVDIPLAGPARGVEGLVLDATNGSHAVFGATAGAGHSVAGDTPADAEDGAGGPNTTAATWGRHQGIGAGIGGVSVGGYGGEFVGGKAHVRLIQVDNTEVDEADAVVGPPTDDDHAIGELFADGAGALYYHQGGDMGFTRVTNQTVLLPDIQRAYDSREEFPVPASVKGRHTDGEIREIDLTAFSDMPADASGAIINVTVAETDALGYALVFNGDTDTTDGEPPIGSSVNYVDAGMFVANGITVATSDTGTVKVFTRTSAEVIIDVVGYIA